MCFLAESADTRPEEEERATQTVLQQPELLCAEVMNA
jgi:hypothetical protein